jgi:hypothetical protein
MDLAYLRDEADVLHYGEELLLACLLHVKKPAGRQSKAMDDIRRIMKDPNLEE